MGYKQPSSGLPFKEMGSSPAKDTEGSHEDHHKPKSSPGWPAIPKEGEKESPADYKESPAKQQKKDEPGKYDPFAKSGAPVEPFNWDIEPREKVNWTQEYLKGGQKGLTGRAALEAGTSINPDQKEVTRLQDEYRESSKKNNKKKGVDLLKQHATESAQELATQIGQNWIDKNLINPKKKTQSKKSKGFNPEDVGTN